MSATQKIEVVDSHTEGEPTRVVLSGLPTSSATTLADRVKELRHSHDWLRSGIACEPRGSDAVVGAYLCEPTSPGADAGVIFFNNVGYLGMCGHGTIGLVRTLQHLGKVQPGHLKIDTPVGPVEAILHEDGRVSVRNVRSYRLQKNVTVQTARYGEVTGDIAYGGNWFFLVEDLESELSLKNLDSLTRFAVAVREGLAAAGITGDQGAEVDHIEIFGTPQRHEAHSRNFVLCPGLAYDRSPCGTGLSAKLACLEADDKLHPGQTWRQESVIGSLFEGEFERAEEGGIRPLITGRAHITGQSTLIFDPSDPFRAGITG